MSEAPEDIKPETAWKRYPIEGVELWKNPKNGFCVFELHYTANPLKRSETWKAHVKSGLSTAKFEQEYEIKWDAFRGKKVYTDFSKKIHGSLEPIMPERGLPLLRGWDFGLTPACIVCQLQGRQLVVLKEFVAVNMGIKRFVKEVVNPGCRMAFPAWSNPNKDYLDFIDPAGLAKAQTDETTCAQHMYAGGCKKIFPGPINWEERRTGVENFLLKFYRRGDKILPGMQIVLSECPTVVQGFQGGYMYPEKAAEIEPGVVKPLKNKYSHIHDALQMVCGSVESLMRPGFGKIIDIPVPGYGFGSRR